MGNVQLLPVLRLDGWARAQLSVRSGAVARPDRARLARLAQCPESCVCYGRGARPDRCDLAQGAAGALIGLLPTD